MKSCNGKFKTRYRETHTKIGKTEKTNYNELTQQLYLLTYVKPRCFRYFIYNNSYVLTTIIIRVNLKK